MDRLASIFQARRTSRSLRVIVFSRVRKKFRATCIVIVPAPCWVPVDEVRRGGPQDAQVIDAAVRVEPLVLGGQDGLLHDIRDVADAYDGPPLLAEFAQEVALGGNDPQGNLGLVVGQAFERRQRRIKERQHEGAQKGAHDPQPKQDGPDVEEPPP